MPRTASTFPYRFRSPVTEITAVPGPGVTLPARGRVGTVFIAPPPRGGDTTRSMRMPHALTLAPARPPFTVPGDLPARVKGPGLGEPGRGRGGPLTPVQHSPAAVTQVPHGGDTGSELRAQGCPDDLAEFVVAMACQAVQGAVAGIPAQVDVTSIMPGSTVGPGNSRDRPAIQRRSGAGARFPRSGRRAHRTNAPPGIISRPSNALSARITSRLVPWSAAAPAISFSSS